MDQILVIDDSEDIREIITMMIESEFEAEIIEASDGAQAIELIDRNPNLSVIMCDYDMPNKNGGDVYKHMLLRLNKPFILVSGVDNIEDENLDGFDQRTGNFKLDKPFEHEKLTSIISLAIKLSSQMNSDDFAKSTPTSKQNDLVLQSKNSGYFRIKSIKIKSHQKFIADTFIKINDKKYIKIGNQGAIVSKDQINRYLDKDIDYFYLNKEQFNHFLNNSLTNLATQLNDLDIQTPEAISLQLNSIQQVQEVVRALGVKKQVIELTDKVASSVSNTLKKEKNLKSFIKSIMHKEDYFFEHSNIINYLCGAMVKELGWDKDRATKRFITVSMFMDISLNDPLLAAIQTTNDSLFKQLNKSDQAEILSHQKNAIEIISKSKTIQGDEFKIIEQHHEKPDGSGFPKRLTAGQIPPQSAVFILAHDFSYQLIKNGGPEKISSEQIFKNLGDFYSRGNFEKPYLALKKALVIQ